MGWIKIEPPASGIGIFYYMSSTYIISSPWYLRIIASTLFSILFMSRNSNVIKCYDHTHFATEISQLFYCHLSILYNISKVLSEW